MQRTAINTAWEFLFGEPSSLMGVPQESKIVNLPYDFMIGRDVDPDSAGGAEAGFYTGATGAYTKHIAFSAEELNNRNVLCIDGCAGTTKVIVNGHLAARHHYAYTSFDVDLGPYLVEGDNRITIVASNTDQPNGRWYTGAGLYRGVELLSAPLIHIANNGIFAYTKSVSKNGAIIGIDVSLENHTPHAQTVEVSIDLHDRINPFFQSEVLNTSGPVGATKAIAWVAADGSTVVHTQIYVPMPERGLDVAGVERVELAPGDDDRLHAVSAHPLLLRHRRRRHHHARQLGHLVSRRPPARRNHRGEKRQQHSRVQFHNAHFSRRERSAS